MADLLQAEAPWDEAEAEARARARVAQPSPKGKPIKHNPWLSSLNRLPSPSPGPNSNEAAGTAPRPAVPAGVPQQSRELCHRPAGH